MSSRLNARRWWVCGAVSLALHGGLLWAFQWVDPRRPVVGGVEAIPVQILHLPEPPPPAPPGPPRAKAPRRTPRAVAAVPSTPEAEPAPNAEPPGSLAPTPEPAASTPVPTEVDESPAVAATPTPPEAPPTDYSRVFAEAEVERRAEPTAALRPRYPERERRRGRESSVLVELTVDADGGLREVEVLESGGHVFDRAALAALRRARFRPASVGGRAVASRLRFRMRFALR